MLNLLLPRQNRATNYVKNIGWQYASIINWTGVVSCIVLCSLLIWYTLIMSYNKRHILYCRVGKREPLIMSYHKRHTLYCRVGKREPLIMSRQYIIVYCVQIGNKLWGLHKLSTIVIWSWSWVPNFIYCDSTVHSTALCRAPPIIPRHHVCWVVWFVWSQSCDSLQLSWSLHCLLGPKPCMQVLEWVTTTPTMYQLYQPS